jgi:hypothetical protein
MWTFTANTGDNIVLRIGTTNFSPVLDLYGPNGAWLDSVQAGTGGFATGLASQATNSGTFTVLVCSLGFGGIGTYGLHFAEFPEPFVVPAGNEGGAMTSGANQTGVITFGDLDMWRFTACKGDLINLMLKTTNFNATLQLFGPNGATLKTLQDGTVFNISYAATNCGTFTVLVRSYQTDDTGTYGLTANGLSDGLKLCRPVIAGTTLTLNGVGGNSGTNFILYSSTNVAKPFGLWTSVLTNQFDPLGVLTYTNLYNPTVRQLYFRFTEME